MSAKPYKTLAGLESEVKRRLSWSGTCVITSDPSKQMVYVRNKWKADIFPSPVLESLFRPKLQHEIDVENFYNENFERELRLTIRLEPFKV